MYQDICNCICKNTKKRKWKIYAIQYVKPTAQLVFKNQFPKGGPTCRRQVVNPRHQTSQGLSHYLNRCWVIISMSCGIDLSTGKLITLEQYYQRYIHQVELKSITKLLVTKPFWLIKWLTRPQLTTSCTLLQFTLMRRRLNAAFKKRSVKDWCVNAFSSHVIN